MKVKMLLVAVAALVFAGLGWAAPGAISFVNDGVELWTTCAGTTPIPDGADIWVYNDIDADGPDATDPLATLCNNPPSNCTAPMYSLNVNHFYMNGVYWYLGAGYFITDYTVSTGEVPPGNQGKLYVRVILTSAHCDTVWNQAHNCWLSYQCVTTTVKWTCSNVGTIVSGSYDDLYCTDWTCATTVVTGDVVVNPEGCCTPDRATYFDPRPYPGWGHYNFNDCATVCVDHGIHTVYVGPVAAPNRIPDGAYVASGCMLDRNDIGCHETCTPATGWVFGPVPTSAWRYLANLTPPTVQVPGNYYVYDILPLTGATDGCICIYVDVVLPVEGTVDVAPLDKSAKITVTTQSESDIDKFVVSRDGEVVKTFDATNTTTAHTYTYVDGNLENGHIYSYEVRYVDINGTETVMATESVSPSWEHATVTEYALYQNYPNPFNPSTKIAFDVLNKGAVTLTVYNATGQLVTTLISGVEHNQGRYSVAFDAGNLTSGLYFYTVKIGNEFAATKKMLLVK
jgi:hypothetical protein